MKFLREIGEFTEASYHFPQGLHLGHILYILKTLLGGRLKGTHLDSNYIRIRGNLGEDRLGAFQRQTKYKLQGLMELGLIVDDRKIGADTDYHLQLTPKGKEVAEALKPLFKKLDLEGKLITKVFLDMHAVGLMLNYLYRIERRVTITKNSIYQNFFQALFVASYCDQNGIEAATEEGAKRRCPFLLNILEATGIIKQETSSIEVLQFVLSTQTIQLQHKESEQQITERINKIENAPDKLSKEEVSLLKETFGKEFLTEKYYLKTFKTVK